MSVIGQDIDQAKAFLEEGKLVGIPTETVYGLAGNALDASAVASIFEVKNRPNFDPLIVHISARSEAEKYVREIPEALQKLADRFWPGPLTILLPKKEIIPDLVTSGLERVAIRVPSHPLTLNLLSRLEFPIAAPSANPFGYISPTRPEHVADQLGDKVPYILDGGPCKVGLESTIVGMENGEVMIYRLGGLEIIKIEEVVGKVSIKKQSSSNPQSPGLLLSHYSPRKPLVIGDLEDLVKKYRSEGIQIAVLSLKKEFSNIPEALQIQLSPKGDMKEAAQRLFAAMRTLDESEAELILSEWMPENGLGRAINDRLRRAAALV